MQMWLVQPFLSRIDALVADLERRVLRQLETAEPDSVLEVGSAHSGTRLKYLLAQFLSPDNSAARKLTEQHNDVLNSWSGILTCLLCRDQAREIRTACLSQMWLQPYMGSSVSCGTVVRVQRAPLQLHWSSELIWSCTMEQCPTAAMGQAVAGYLFGEAGFSLPRGRPQWAARGRAPGPPGRLGGCAIW